MIDETKRTSSKTDGAIVTEIKLEPMLTFVSAKWIATILTSNKWPTWVMYWIEELKGMALHYNFPSVNHMMNARSFKLTSAPQFQGQTFQIYTNNSARAFMDMGYKYNHPNPTWESVANQLIWFNPEIINPVTNEPFSWDDPLW